MPLQRPDDGIHTVRGGEWASSIAHEFGIEDWKGAVWDAGENAALKDKRDPFVLAPADKLFIPEVGTKKESAATTKRHTYELVAETDVFRVRLMKDDDTPLNGITVFYVVDTSEGYSTWVMDHGDTDEDGLLTIECPRSAVEITLEYTMTDSVAETEIPCRVSLRVGQLRPVRSDDTEKVRVIGVQARLRGLGFTPGPLDGVVGPLTLAAVRSFQAATGEKAYRKMYGLSVAIKIDGRITQEVTDALIKAYGA